MSYPCPKDECNGTMMYVDDEYGSLADGGSYERFTCDTCGRVHYSPLPD